MSTGADPAAATAVDSGLHAATLAAGLAWLDRVLQARLADYFGTGDAAARKAPPPLKLKAADRSGYARLVREAGLSADAQLVLLLALAPHLQPQLLDTLLARNRNLDRGFTEFGGARAGAHSGFLPTVQTALFLLAGADLARRLAVARQLDADQPLRRLGLLRLDHDAPTEPAGATLLQLPPETLGRLTTGAPHKPDFGPGFPARRISTTLGWDDLVLAPEVLDEVDNLITWTRDSRRIADDFGLQRVVRPGYRALFFGPPGTGKTLTATLIGQQVGADVYRIDLAMVVSKYIGETEKNLAAVFDQAQDRQWVLFFDEADALFGKRTSTTSSNDRHANQEVSFLLQRVEDFPGTVILASNLKSNIDEAFARRFQAMVNFPMPDAEQRLRLWQALLGPPGRAADDVQLPALADAHELSGGAIANVVQFAAIRARRDGRSAIVARDLARGIARELRKEGRSTPPLMP